MSVSRTVTTSQRAAMLLQAFLVTLVLTGCQPFHAPKSWKSPWSNSKKEPILPDRIVAVWSDTVLHQPGEPGLRGFGGRLFFYEGENKDPLEVDGGLAVYVFDADKLDPHSPTPERKFVFNADQFASHMSNSEMGCSYSVWLPWDEVGGPSRRLSIVARFEGRKGGTVISQPTIKLLPGSSHKVSVRHESSAPASVSASSEGGALRQVGFEESPAADESSRRNQNTTRHSPYTIDLPPSFYQRHLQTTTSAPSPGSADRSTMNEDASPRTSTTDATMGRDQNTPASPISNAATTTRHPQRDIENSDDRSDSRENRWERSSPNHPSRFPNNPSPRSRNIRREPLPAGSIESLPQTPRR